MAFTINETGIQDKATGTTKVVFETPVIIADRDAETPADTVHDVSLAGTPVAVAYVRSQSAAFLRLYVRRLLIADVLTLRTLLASGAPVEVKLTPGSATLIDCMFGPRSEQKLTPWNGDHPDAAGDGSALDPLLTQYNAELFLLRL